MAVGDPCFRVADRGDLRTLGARRHDLDLFEVAEMGIRLIQITGRPIRLVRVPSSTVCAEKI